MGVHGKMTEMTMLRVAFVVLSVAISPHESNAKAFGDLSGATDAYGYNLRSEVVSSRRTLADSPVRGFDYDYAYDPIGNRTSATDYDEQGNPLVSSYTANALNQYTQRTIPGYAALRGEAATHATVTVNERPVWRINQSIGGSAAPTSARSGGNLGGEAAQTSPHSGSYDADGNMTSDGRFHYFLGPGQQCVYDSAGKLITKGSAVGTPDHTAPVPVDWWIPVPKLFHCKDDCWQWIISEEYDHKTHPPNKGVGCPENDGKDYPPSKSKCPKLDNRL